MPNPKGNPEIKKHGFKTDRDESLTESLTIKVTKSMLEKLKSIDNYRDKCRQAITRMIDELSDEEK
ncbi:PAS/PAC sensor hybrid histidine kinase [Nostoc sp. NIES-4103]|nr:PAS/PAC sensor hybrid histidine kinase [Nostoc sp. NIES-4103]